MPFHMSRIDVQLYRILEDLIYIFENSLVAIDKKIVRDHVNFKFSKNQQAL